MCRRSMALQKEGGISPYGALFRPSAFLVLIVFAGDVGAEVWHRRDTNPEKL